MASCPTWQARQLAHRPVSSPGASFWGWRAEAKQPALGCGWRAKFKPASLSLSSPLKSPESSGSAFLLVPGPPCPHLGSSFIIGLGELLHPRGVWGAGLGLGFRGRGQLSTWGSQDEDGPICWLAPHFLAVPALT